MKLEHALILKKLEDYFEQDGAEHLRFFQGLYNIGIIRTESVNTAFGTEVKIKDDYNIKDNELIKNIKL